MEKTTNIKTAMTDEQKLSTVEKLKQYQSDKRLSLEAMGKLIDCNKATYHNIIALKWQREENLVSEVMWSKCAAFLVKVGVDKGKWKLRNTTSHADITEICSNAQHKGCMYAIFGDTGLGKTTGLELYASKNPKVYYVLVSIMTNQKTFIKDIAKSMQLDASGTKEDVLNRIADHLNSTTGSLLLIDDIGKAKVDDIYRIVQLIYDKCAGNSGIVMAGMPVFKKYIDKMCDKDKSGFRELSRRVRYWLELGKPSADEIEMICADFGIREKKAIGFISRTCSNFGSLREFLEEAHDQAAGQPITIDLLLTLKFGK